MIARDFCASGLLVRVSFAGADVISVIDRKNKDAAVSDFSRSRRGDDGFQSLFDAIVCEHQLNHDLRQEGDAVLRTAVDGLMALLAPVSAHFCNRHSRYIKS